MKVGAILFDRDNAIFSRGKSIVSLGSAWAARGKERPKRIENIHDLDSDTLWFTNLTYQNFYTAGLSKHANYRNEVWLRTLFNQLAAEIGVDPTYVQPTETVSAIACIADTVVKESSNVYGIAPKSHNRLNEDFSIQLAPRSQLSDVIYPIFENIAQHPSVSVIKKVNFSSNSGLTLTLRRNRLAHARQLLSINVPSDLNWELVRSDNYKQHSFLSEVDKPFLVKATLENINPNVAEILSWGSGAQRLRDWLTDAEFRLALQYADVTIHKVLLCQNDARPITLRADLPNGKFDELSITKGLIAEQIWTGFTNKLPYKGKESRFTAAAAWLRAADRLIMFDYAKRLFASGLDVISYGVGNVVIRYPENSLNRAMEIATDLGLLSPTSKFLELKKGVVM